MKKCFLLLFLTSSLNLFAQQDNYTFFKLIVSNKENKIMLVKWNGAWEIPGARYNRPITIAQFADTLAAEHGLAVKNKKLNGVLTFEYENRPTLTVMHYYTAQYKSGSLVVPESCEQIGWFTVKQALTLIPYPEMKLMVTRAINQPNVLWGAAIRKRVDNQMEIVEDFYKLK